MRIRPINVKGLEQGALCNGRLATIPSVTTVSTAEVIVTLSSEDGDGLPSVVAHMLFDLAEARAVAARLLAAADKAEAMQAECTAGQPFPVAK